MVNIDRFLIGSLISMAAVAYYATPYEAVTKLWIVPSAFSAVLFPAFATALAQDKQRAVLLFERAVKYIFLSLFPIVVGMLALGHFGLRIWLGSAFAEKSSVVFSFLAVGVFANSLAQVPFWQIQAANRPDLAAKVHLCELPFYLVCFWVLTKRFGIDGAALTWMLRTAFDMAVMFWLSGRLLKETARSVRRLRGIMIATVPVFIGAFLLQNKLMLGIIFSLVVSLGTLWVAWHKLLSSRERELVHSPLRFFRGIGTVAAIQDAAPVSIE
jgi:O-antigen/teichoic acid export membrane protein